jgi:hypothetical protein
MWYLGDDGEADFYHCKAPVMKRVHGNRVGGGACLRLQTITRRRHPNYGKLDQGATSTANRRTGLVEPDLHCTSGELYTASDEVEKRGTFDTR